LTLAAGLNQNRIKTMTEQDHVSAIFEASRKLNAAIIAACKDGILVSVDFDFHREFGEGGKRYETQTVKAGAYPAT
jgi:hypothetical protein